MKPELRPGSGTRKAGSPLILASVSMAMRRSARAPISASAMAMVSAAMAIGSAWKLPPERISPWRANTKRIVGHGVGLALDHAGGEAQHVERGAHHLRLAAQGIGILHAVAVDGDLRISLPRSSPCSSFATSIWPGWPRTAWMRASNGVSLPAAASTARAPVTSARAEDILGREEAGGGKRGRDLRAVEERQALLGGEVHRRQAGGLEALQRGDRAAAPAHLADAQQHGRHMGQRRQVAGGADRALGRDAGMDAGIDQLHQRLQHAPPHAGVAEREAVDLEDHDQAHEPVIEQRPGAGGMRQHEAALQLGHLIVGDARARQRAEAGVDAVDGAALADHRLHGVGARFHRRPAAAIEPDRPVALVERAQVGEGELAGTKREDGC